MRENPRTTGGIQLALSYRRHPSNQKYPRSHRGGVRVALAYKADRPSQRFPPRRAGLR